MATIMAVKKYMEREPHGAKCSMTELKEFKAACDPEEWIDLCAAAEALNDSTTEGADNAP